MEFVLVMCRRPAVLRLCVPGVTVAVCQSRLLSVFLGLLITLRCPSTFVWITACAPALLTYLRTDHSPVTVNSFVYVQARELLSRESVAAQ